MKYSKVVKAIFVDRPNRFVANVVIKDRNKNEYEDSNKDKDSETIAVHVKNTGRCKELLVPGAVVYLEDFGDRMGKRKMRYDLVTVEKALSYGTRLMVNMDSQSPNKVVKEALEKGKLHLPGMGALTTIRPETVYGDSRFDFYVEDINGHKGFLEVKGVTLENDGVCSFPDAPTERGVKHMHELIKAYEDGFLAYALFLVQMEGMQIFTPADDHDPDFGNALREADKQGVKILCYNCLVTSDTVLINEPVRIKL